MDKIFGDWPKIHQRSKDRVIRVSTCSFPFRDFFFSWNQSWCLHLPNFLTSSHCHTPSTLSIMWLKDSFKTWTFWPIESKLRKLSEVSFPGLLVISVFWINGMDAFKVRTCWSNKTVFSCRPSLLGNTLHKKIYVLKCFKITIVMLIKLKIHGLLWGGCWRRAFLKPRRRSLTWTVSTCLVKVFFKGKRPKKVTQNQVVG